MRVDTSSAPAAGNDVVELATAALAALTADPIWTRSSAAVANNSGVATTYDTGVSFAANGCEDTRPPGATPGFACARAAGRRPAPWLWFVTADFARGRRAYNADGMVRN
jgi:hypothetical protein